MNIMGLVQLTQAAQPGGYSHTFGIEGLIASRQLTSPDHLEQLLTDLLQNRIAPADGIATGIAFRAAREQAFERLPGICSTMSRLPGPTREASLEMGRRLWGVSRHWEWAEALHDQLDGLAERTDLHHAVAFGALVSEATANQLRAIAACLLHTARGIVLAAIHGVPLDEVEGQRILSHIQPTIAELAAQCVDQDESQIRPIQ